MGRAAGWAVGVVWLGLSASLAWLVVALAVVVSEMPACVGAPVAPALDIGALELACVGAATTPQAATDCRNAVRTAWAKANGIAKAKK
jgi:hypothetical protein